MAALATPAQKALVVAAPPAPSGASEALPIVAGRYLVEFVASAPSAFTAEDDAAAGPVDRLRARRSALRSVNASRVAALEALGAEVVEAFWIVDCTVVDVDDDRLEAVRRLEGVRRVWSDRLAAPTSAARIAPPAPIRDSTNRLNHASDVVQAAGVLGSGAILSVLDTGLDLKTGASGRPHRSFYVNGNPRNTSGGGVQGSRVAFQRQAGRLAAENSLTHGTLVAGIAAGEVWSTSNADRGHAPRAQLRSYSIVDDAKGNASFTSILRAWQQVVGEKDHKSLVVLLAYSGSPDPTHPTQVALDRAAAALDALVVVSAGNGASSSAASHAAINGISVGATYSQGRKTMWPSSTRGPLRALPKGFYPLLCANGVEIVGPRADAETRDSVDTGTSLAAAQVAGALTWLRGFAPRLSALQCKAALLASLEDIAARNKALDRQSFGLGYLRSDQLLTGVRGAPVLAASSLTSARRTRDFQWRSAANAAWSVVCTWNRLELSKASFSDLAIEVYAGQTLLAQSDESQMNLEALRFRAPTAGTLTVRVRAKSLDAATLPFAVCVMPTRLPYVEASMTTYGKSCAGSLPGFAVSHVVPPSEAKSMQASQSRYVSSGLPQRTQFMVSAALLPTSVSMDGIALRQDDSAPIQALRGVGFDAELRVGYAAVTPAAAQTIFAKNIRGSLGVVMAARKILMPDYVIANRSPGNFAVRLPFDRPFKFDGQTGDPLLLELRSPAAARRVYYLTDAIDSRNAESRHVATVHAASPTATVGAVFQRYLPVLGILGRTGAQRVSPVLWGSGVPDVGRRAAVEYSGFTPSAFCLRRAVARRLGDAVGSLPPALRHDALRRARLCDPVQRGRDSRLRYRRTRLRIAADRCAEQSRPDRGDPLHAGRVLRSEGQPIPVLLVERFASPRRRLGLE